MNRKLSRLLAGVLALVLCLSLSAAALAYETIPFGATGTEVRELQSALKSKGYYKGTVDGEFGQKTRSAVYRYQKAIGLDADGKAGNRTLTALYDGISALNEIDDSKRGVIRPKNPATLCYGCSGTRVKSLQKALKNLGYYKGSVDGNFGELTETAVKRYQWAHGLRGDGMAGTRTLKSISDNQARKLSTTFLLTVGSRGETVERVQGRLRRLGYTISDTKGYFGTDTATAVRSYQTDYGITVTGELTESGYSVLMKTLP